MRAGGARHDVSLPEPLPGTHLAQVDCVDCGTYVLVVPERADTARCSGCAREKAGAVGFTPPPRPASRDRPVRTAQADPRRAVLVPPILPITAICTVCRWRCPAIDGDEASIMVRLHRQTTHDPNGWLSGVKGGKRRR
jgi:hypothetical protein